MIIQKKINLLNNLKNTVKNNSISFFLLLWLLLPLIVFFLAHSRLILYVLPVYVPVALAVARSVRIQFSEQNICKKILPVALGLCVILTAGKGILACYPTSRNMKSLYEVCRTFDKQTSFIAYHESSFMGLQYYLEKPVIKISIAGEVTFRGKTKSLNGLINHIQNSWPQNKFVIITRKDHSRKLEGLLHRFGFLFSENQTRFWKLYSLRPCIQTDEDKYKTK